MEVVRCGIHGFGEAIGIDADEVRVFWKLNFASEHATQVAYRLIVSSGSSIDVARDGLCYDSGRVESSEQRNVLCRPKGGFKSTTLYFWTVRVWDQDGNEAISSINELYTSYPRSSRLLPPYSMNQTYMPHSSLIFRTWFEDEPNRWKAVWIGDGGDKPIYLRKTLSLNGKKPSRVFVFASGLGHFNLSINGQAASPHVLDPGWTNYHKTVQFVGYDVTDKFVDGENVIGAHVGNGFYAGDQGDRFFWPKYEDNTYVRYGNELCFFAEIHVHYADGSYECIISDPTWSVRKSATTLANIYASEDHDSRAYPVGWDAPGFDGADWKPAKPLTGPRGKLRYQSQPPVVLHDTFVPISVTVVKPGVIMYDLGQNSSIMVRVEASGPAGAQYRVKYSETIGEDGMVFMPDPLFKEFETGVYSKITLSGKGETEVWMPDFSFTSARYIQIEGACLKTKDAYLNDETAPLNGEFVSINGEDVSLGGEVTLPTIHSLTPRHVSSAAQHLGFVKTDKQDVNALINACYWSFNSNIFSYHTDCPQIEKFGWLEVSSLLFPSTQYMRDMEGVYSKILDDIIDAQEPSGLVPTMAPLVRYMCGPMHDTITWGGAVCLLPELIKRYYGSTATFAKIYKPCVQYMEYMEQKERDGGLIEHGLGDWGRDIAFGNHQANIETAVYYKCLRNVAIMAKELGFTDDELKFTSWAERIYAVYNKNLLITDKKDFPYAFYTSIDNPGTRDRTMVAQAVALQFDLVPPENRADIITAFLADIEDSGHVMRAGEIGLKYLWNTLAEADVDRPDIVLDMARQEEHPSYMRFLRQGETTLLEFWQDNCRSKCHDMLGTIYEWFYSYVLGVQPLTDAYRTWRLRPCFKAEFDFIQGEIESPYGMISVEFDRRGRQDGKAVVLVTVPTGTVCELVLPGETSETIIRRDNTKETRVSKGKTLSLLQGKYHLEIVP
ncbi:bacterial alpha-L-rhamnosidase-domain-containing protein [Truncatella angustata]|uniref:alpha-L-rhamnosidase n=1 Tax=Truncatella angustata TaxID=152316 RepID=A0A9P8ZVW8_9PEZI|nr:bacterial alpha-L-rhamnosidase-domain-containing protein [Truncatella angustata]KAH6651512.1 bacterial alpha-L-rhamnosidase-domain-containing protein [Truncatella angustata]